MFRDPLNERLLSEWTHLRAMRLRRRALALRATPATRSMAVPASIAIAALSLTGCYEAKAAPDISFSGTCTNKATRVSYPARAMRYAGDGTIAYWQFRDPNGITREVNDHNSDAFDCKESER